MMFFGENVFIRKENWFLRLGYGGNRSVAWLKLVMSVLDEKKMHGHDLNLIISSPWLVQEAKLLSVQGTEAG